MTRSACTKCQSITFEIVEGKPPGTDATIQLVRCARCGTTFGALDDNLQDFIEGQAKQLQFDLKYLATRVERALNVIESSRHDRVAY
jgi:hypothetical protein